MSIIREKQLMNRLKDSDNKKLIQLRRQNKTNKEIAIIFNVTSCQVRLRFTKLGFKPETPNWTDEDIIFLKENYVLLGSKECAKKLNRSRNSVFSQAKRLKIPTESKTKKSKCLKIVKDRDFYYKEYITNQKTPEKIAEEIGVTPKSLKDSLQRFNINLRTKAENILMENPDCPLLSQIYFDSLSKNAAKRNLKFDITLEYAWDLFLKQNKICALSGVPIELVLVYYGKDRVNQTASLDRIDSSKSLGYMEGNVQWVHKDLNWMKGRLKQKNFLKWIKIVNDYQMSKLLKSIKNSDLIILDYEGIEINQISTCPKSHLPPSLP